MDIDEFPHLKAWEERMVQRPGVERGRHVPSPHRMKEMSKEEMEKLAQESGKCTYMTAPGAREFLVCDANPLGLETWLGSGNGHFAARSVF